MNDFLRSRNEIAPRAQRAGAMNKPVNGQTDLWMVSNRRRLWTLENQRRYKNVAMPDFWGTSTKHLRTWWSATVPPPPQYTWTTWRVNEVHLYVQHWNTCYIVASWLVCSSLAEWANLPEVQQVGQLPTPSRLTQAPRGPWSCNFV
uniref:SFRICE_035448 n=1 Tax=Spodoptera frugiperda TaxID=7108 RepID=A0A2H1WZG9_SPOFR